MSIHKEGRYIILFVIVFLAVLNSILYISISIPFILIPISFISLVFLLLVVWFFRYPKRKIIIDDNKIVAPADGKVVVIENVNEPEYFKDERKQVSIFMSPLNVHINWYPVSGKVSYTKYHPGKYLVAWHPKSSTLNERSTVVVRKENNVEVLVRQIAGALARRIVTYSKTSEDVKQGGQLGFIKFGSRVDLFLPTDAKINVQIDQKVEGKNTIIAEL